ncbi:MAG: TIGR02757 family protein [Thermoanaerobaculia bacterium]|nr:TIGR02757 family protein [Thermoanaerobaculia bacterium]
MPTRPVRDRHLLARRLGELSEQFTLESLSPDPLEVVREFEDPLDQEVVGLIAAAFAYGRADIVVRNVRGVVERMDPSPSRYLLGFERRRARRHFSGFSHRFHKRDDLVSLLEAIAAALDREGSLGELFETVHEPADEHIGPSLARFTEALIGFVRGAPPSLNYLLSSPEGGSACKRMNLYLRWMVRTESPDLGLWTFVDPAQLVMPLDTHVHRITTFLGLSTRRSADWKTALALTREMRSIDPFDPVRFDFAICRLGILDRCSRKRAPEQCDVCLLRDVCSIRV